MKHRYWIVVAAAVAGLLAGAQGRASSGHVGRWYTPPDDTPKVNVGGTIFADYTYQMDPLTTDSDGHTIHTSGFNLQRAYINVTGSISHWISFRITPDVVRVGPVTVGGANVNVPGLTGHSPTVSSTATARSTSTTSRPAVRGSGWGSSKRRSSTFWKTSTVIGSRERSFRTARAI
jgi:hypothetical protein